jgi:RNA polymerase sigma factor
MPFSPVSEPPSDVWREEIARYVERLEAFGLSLADLSRGTPKRRDVRQAVKAVAALVARDPTLYGHLMTYRTLPVHTLSRYVALSPRLLERHRQCIIALALISRSEFPHLYAYLRAGQPR